MKHYEPPRAEIFFAADVITTSGPFPLYEEGNDTPQDRFTISIKGAKV